MTPVIEVKNLSKRYLVGHQADTRSQYVALRERHRPRCSRIRP